MLLWERVSDSNLQMVLWLSDPTPGILRLARAEPTSACVTPSFILRCLNLSANASSSLGSDSTSLMHAIPLCTERVCGWPMAMAWCRWPICRWCWWAWVVITEGSVGAPMPLTDKLEERWSSRSPSKVWWLRWWWWWCEGRLFDGWDMGTVDDEEVQGTLLMVW